MIHDEVQVPAEAEDPLIAGSSAFGRSGSVLDELITRLSHDDPLLMSLLLLRSWNLVILDRVATVMITDFLRMSIGSDTSAWIGGLQVRQNLQRWSVDAHNTTTTMTIK